MGRDTVQLETAINTISQEYLLKFTSEYGIPEALHPELPGPEDRIVDFPEGKNNRFFWVDERVFPTVVDWRMIAPKDEMPAENTYSAEAVRTLDTHRTPIQKQPEVLLCLVGISRRYYLRDKVYGPVQFNSRSQSHKDGGPSCSYDSSGVPFTIKRSLLDFATEAGAEDQGTVALEVPPPEDVPTTRGAPEAGPAEGVAATDPSTAKESRKRGHNGVDANASPKLGMGSTRPAPVPENAPMDVSDPDPLSFADPRSRHPTDVAQSSQGTAAAGDPESENASFASMVGSPKSIYRPDWGIANGSMLDTPEAYQDLVAMGSQLRLRFEQEAKLLKKSVAQVARRDKRIQAKEQEIKNLEALLEAEADMKKVAEDKSRHPTRAAIACRRWMIGHGLRLAVVKCSESLELRQAFADVVSARVAKGMNEGLRHGVEHGRAQLDLKALEAHDPEVEAKYITALQALKDLKYPLVDQLEGLKDAPMDVIMVALYLESDTGDDAPQWVRDLLPSSSQLTIRVYPEPCEEEEKMPHSMPYAWGWLRVSRPIRCVTHAPWESLRIPNVLGMALRTQSPRPPGLQPVYAADHV
nr:hypothetical protein [Tanacetum cinerariifolium]